MVAQKLFRRAVQEKPDFAAAHAHLGLLYFQKGRVDDAVPQLREALRIDSSRTDALDAMVHILRNQSKTAAAAGDSGKVSGVAARSPQLRARRSRCQFELGAMALQLSLWQDAIAAFEQALKLRQDDPAGSLQLGARVSWGVEIRGSAPAVCSLRRSAPRRCIRPLRSGDDSRGAREYGGGTESNLSDRSCWLPSRRNPTSVSGLSN